MLIKNITIIYFMWKDSILQYYQVITVHLGKSPTKNIKNVYVAGFNVLKTHNIFELLLLMRNGKFNKLKFDAIRTASVDRRVLYMSVFCVWTSSVYERVYGRVLWVSGFFGGADSMEVRVRWKNGQAVRTKNRVDGRAATSIWANRTAHQGNQKGLKLLLSMSKVVLSACLPMRLLRPSHFL